MEKKNKKRLVVSFSGGETSAFMTYYIINKMQNDYEIVVVFANTGQEHEETLIFIEKFSKLHKFNVYWVEADVNFEKGKGTKCKVVDFNSASRNGEPFESVIKKYGIPNQAFPHCNRELKLAPINDFIKNVIGWKSGSYYTAIGIRYDEIDRMSKDRLKRKLIYPLISEIKMTKQKINFWFSNQPFRLNLKGYQGNCITCWKKSFNNLYAIANEDENYFNFFKIMEEKYGDIESLDRKLQYDENGNIKPYVFFRGNKSTIQVLNESKNINRNVKDANSNTSYQIDLFDEESCDIFSQCGTDN